MASSWFERNPRKTIIIFLAMSFLILDVLAGNIHRWVVGCSWAERGEIRDPNDERNYRVRSKIYDHDLAKYVSIDDEGFGPIEYCVRTNSLGFRDRSTREVPLVSDHHRIVFMGDSFTEGVGLNYEHTYVGIVDEALSKRGIEVLNAGVAGYSPTIYWKKTKYLIEEVGLQFDEMVVLLDMSDALGEVVLKSIYDSATSSYKIDRREDTAIVAKSLTMQFWDLVRANTVLMHYALARSRYLYIDHIRRKPLSVDHRSGLWTVDEDAYREYGQLGVALMDSAMGKLYDLLQENSIPLTVVVTPWPCQVYHDDAHSIHVSYWRKWCQQRNIKFLDVFPYFVNGKTREERLQIIDQYYFHRDVHFNEKGYRLVAEVFLDFYEQQ